MTGSAAKFDSFRTLFDVPHLQKSEVVQLGRGALDAKRRVAFGKDAMFYHVSASPMFAATQVGLPEWVGVLLPISRTGVHTVNGKDVSSWQGYFLDGRDEYAVVAEARDTYTLAIRRKRLAQACASLMGVEDARLDLTSRLLELGQDLNMSLRAVAARAIAHSSPLHAGSATAVVPAEIEADVISTCATLLAPIIGAPLRTPGGTQRTGRIVRMARELLDQAPPASVGLAEMCAASGVGATRLHQAFVHQYGIPAGRYLLNYRLTKAREVLLDPASPPTLVKEVALSFGFPSSGRFALYYRRLFGENPSATLERAAVDPG